MRHSINVHHTSEFHEQPLECGCCSVYYAERISDYPTSDLPQQIILLKNGWHYVLYRVHSTTMYQSLHGGDNGIKHVHLKPRYTPDNTVLYMTPAGKKTLWHIVDGVPKTIIASQVEYEELHVKVDNISTRFAELLIQTHLNAGNRFDTNLGPGIQATGFVFEFKTYPANQR